MKMNICFNSFYKKNSMPNSTEQISFNHITTQQYNFLNVLIFLN